MKDIFSLEGKNAVVVGGAGGIGEAIAQGLINNGANVAIASRSIDNLNSAAEEIQKETGKKVLIFQVDAGDEDSVKKLVADVIEKMGRVDILVNSMGFNVKSSCLDFPMDKFDTLMNVNVRGVMLCCKEFANVMVDQNGGKIINVSSVRGVRASAGGNSGYCATKGAVDMLTRTFAAELAPKGINVNAIGPALIATKLTAKQMMEPGRTEKYIANIPLGRIGVTEDVVGASVFLAAPASDFITGQIIYIDGGLTAIG
ncbi:MAG: glucose 1-dehydrogenase [Eubacteriales bacterium]